jgi:hypothetical protein
VKIPGESIGLILFLIGAALALAVAPMAMAQSAGDSVKEQLRRAFDRTFHQPGVRLMDLRVSRGGRVVAHRRFEMAHRTDPDGSRSLIRFVAPVYLRGHALLIVGSDDDGPSDTWVYQPEERRPRRAGTSQNGDSFYGRDVALEDLERTRWDRWRIAAWLPVEESGEDCLVADAWPPPESQYGRLRIWVATRVDGVLRIDFFARGKDGTRAGAQPLKRLRTNLSNAVDEHGFLRFQRILVEQIGRDARTELVIERIAIDPAISASLFSAMRLEREGEGLFDLAERHARDAGR